MDNRLVILEKSIEETGGKLEVIADKITACDLQSETVSTEPDTVAVESLLETVKQVQSEYQLFQKDLSEVKILQRQVHAALHEAASELQEAIKSLRGKLVAHRLFANTTAEETET